MLQCPGTGEGYGLQPFSELTDAASLQGSSGGIGGKVVFHYTYFPPSDGRDQDAFNRFLHYDEALYGWYPSTKFGGL